MSGAAIPLAAPSSAAMRRLRALDAAGLIITLVTLAGAILWAFPIYWALVTTIKPEADVIRGGIAFWPANPTLENYGHVLFETKIGLWYVNSLVTSGATTIIIVIMSAGAGYALSQLEFPGKRLIWWMILASFMVPIQALIVNHFVLMSQFHLVNTWTAVVSEQLIAPVTIIIYKQFFDSVPKDFREAAVIDGATEFQLLFRVYLPMNWGVTTALAIITFIAAWNNFLWPFLAVTEQENMNITVGITQVSDAFGVKYARDLATAMLAAAPVALVYLLFQRRVTQAIMLTAGIKG